MLKKIIKLYCLAAFAIGCSDDSLNFSANEDNAKQNSEQLNIENSLKSIPFGSKSNLSQQLTFQDNSGKVTIEVFWEDKDLPAQNPNGYVTIPPDYVLVGGGALTMETNTSSAGAYLTECRPDFHNNRWYAASKDHKVSDPHRLRVYAIGMKLDGVSATTLRNAMTVVETTSSTEHHPNTYAFVNAPYKLIGGGARANWSVYGSLLVHSYPFANAWYAKSKDHIYAETCSITVWAIGILENIPGFGYLDINNSGLSPNFSEISPSIPGYYQTTYNGNPTNAGWVGTCPGAESSSSTSGGRMLAAIQPFPSTATNPPYSSFATSKDNSVPTSGYLRSYMICVRKRP